MIRFARHLLAGQRIGRLDADEYRQLLGDAGDEGRLERLDEDAGGVVGHAGSGSSGTIAGR
jgi:hypothetical protein